MTSFPPPPASYPVGGGGPHCPHPQIPSIGGGAAVYNPPPPSFPLLLLTLRHKRGRGLGFFWGGGCGGGVPYFPPLPPPFRKLCFYMVPLARNKRSQNGAGAHFGGGGGNYGGGGSQCPQQPHRDPNMEGGSKGSQRHPPKGPSVPSNPMGPPPCWRGGGWGGGSSVPMGSPMSPGPPRGLHWGGGGWGGRPNVSQ